MTVFEALKSKIKYPLSDDLINSILIERGLKGTDEYTHEVAKSNEFKGARADCYKELIDAINVGEGGMSISLSDKELILDMANSIYKEIGEPQYGKEQSSVTYLDW